MRFYDIYSLCYWSKIYTSYRYTKMGIKNKRTALFSRLKKEEHQPYACFFIEFKCNLFSNKNLSSNHCYSMATACVASSAKLNSTVSDRKSTRLNSSHVATSYPVFCLNKKTTRTT